MKQKTWIRWTNDEVDKLAAYCAKERVRSPLEAITRILNRAQTEVLPVERRRTIGGPCNEQRFEPALRKQLMTAFVALESNPDAEPPIPPLRVELSTEQPPLDVPKAVGVAPTELLLAELFRRVTSKLDRYEDLLSANTNGNGNGNGNGNNREQRIMPKPFIPAVLTPVMRKTRIAIIGMLPGQWHDVEAKAPKNVDLRFVRADTDTSAIPVSADFIIVSRWASHKSTDRAEAVAPGRVVYEGGGITGVVQRIYDLCARQR